MTTGARDKRESEVDSNQALVCMHNMACLMEFVDPKASGPSLTDSRLCTGYARLHKAFNTVNIISYGVAT